MMCRHSNLIEANNYTALAVEIKDETEGNKSNVIGSFIWKQYICSECKCLITVLQAVVEKPNDQN